MFMTQGDAKISKLFIKQWVNTVLECYINVPLTYYNLLPHIDLHLNRLISKMVIDISILVLACLYMAGSPQAQLVCFELLE